MPCTEGPDIDAASNSFYNYTWATLAESAAKDSEADNQWLLQVSGLTPCCIPSLVPSTNASDPVRYAFAVLVDAFWLSSCLLQPASVIRLHTMDWQQSFAKQQDPFRSRCSAEMLRMRLLSRARLQMHKCISDVQFLCSDSVVCTCRPVSTGCGIEYHMYLVEAAKHGLGFDRDQSCMILSHMTLR